MNKSCSLCHSNNTKKLFQSINKHGRHLIGQQTFEVHQCNNCDTVFVPNVTVNDEYYQKFYLDDYYAQPSTSKSIISTLLDIYTQWSFRQKQNLIIQTLGKDKNIDLLDIGCGGGEFLDALDTHIFNRYGVEINKDGYELCKKKEIDVYNKDIMTINFQNQKFDVITMWHVIEHLENPMAVCKKIYELLKPNGILVISTPNTDSMGFKLGKKDWFHLDSPRHLILFNQKSLDYIWKNSNFKTEVIKNEFYDYPLDLLWSVKDTNYKYLIWPLYPIFKILDRETMTVICRKI